MNVSFFQNYGKKTITIEEIKKHVKYDSQKELFNIIGELISKQVLEPVKSCGKTFETPSIYNKYRIVQEDYSKELEEINKIVILDMTFYRKHPEKYTYDKKYIIAIENYFKTRIEGDYQLSINERSLEIFNDEKYLSSSKGKTIIGNLNLTILNFNVYLTPEVFMYYRNSSCKSGNVIIVENKDTFTTFKKILIDGKRIMDFEFDAIIYGEGRKILSSFEFISDDEFKDFNSKNNTFYYFGDIDSSGINILYEMMHKYDSYNIIPFMSGYDFLIAKKETKGHTKTTEDGKGKNDSYTSLEKIKFCFPNYNVDELYDFCKKSKIIPQETLNNKILRIGGF